MQREDATASLTPEQTAAADTGAKAMMPVGERGRPFLYYLLSTIADAGVKEVCLVVAPDSDRIQRHFHHELTLRRLMIAFAVQEEARGTADALLAAEEFAGDSRVLVLNADNLYPVSAIKSLSRMIGAGVAGFDREVLVREGNVDPERIRRYALLRVGAGGFLEDIVEKPDDATYIAMGEHALVSMNLWAFTPLIFRACRMTTPSPRGELELPSAVRIAMRQGMAVQVAPISEPVLDLASRGDVSTVDDALRGKPVRL
jgi:glucose-1-phosphate thymidylyltransferase